MTLPLLPSNHIVTADEYNAEVSAVNDLYAHQAVYFTGGTAATSAGAEVALTAWTNSVNFTFKNGYVYRLDFSFGAANTDVAGTTGLTLARIRKTVNSTAGVQLLYAAALSRGGGQVNNCFAFAFVKNVSGSDIITTLGATAQRSVGAANSIIYGDANIQMALHLSLLGTTAALPDLAAAAVAIV